MSMDLETALERVEMLQSDLARAGTDPQCRAAAKDAEALRLVLDAARSASVVDLTNAAVAKAREMEQKEAAAGHHAYAAPVDPLNFGAVCVKCWREKCDPIHQKPETTP